MAGPKPQHVLRYVLEAILNGFGERMTRQQVKNALQTALQGIPNVKAVFTARQRLTPNSLTPVITIYLPDVKEFQLTGPAPNGKRRIEITGLLEVIMIDANPKPETGEGIFDGILDAIDAKLRQNFNLAGTVDGSAVKNLETHIAAPQLVEGQNIFRVGLKKFDITVTITGS